MNKEILYVYLLLLLACIFVVLKNNVKKISKPQPKPTPPFFIDYVITTNLNDQDEFVCTNIILLTYDSKTSLFNGTAIWNGKFPQVTGDGVVTTTLPVVFTLGKTSSLQLGNTTYPLTKDPNVQLAFTFNINNVTYKLMPWMDWKWVRGIHPIVCNGENPK